MKFMVLNQVTKSLCIQRISHQFRRYVQSESQTLPRGLYPLKSRKLLQVSGKDAPAFLQGLITNDIRHFDEGAKSIYAMFLNTKGRVLYDTLIYKWDNSFLLECDASIIQTLQKHLKLYKLKRDVNIISIEKDLKLWVLMAGKDPTLNEISCNDITLYKDPRITDLGCRVVTSQTMTGSELIDKIGTKDIKIESNEEGYKSIRYKLGVSEGHVDITPGSSFPLEANCDYLHGVSFHKGCYIGQEVTARVHHTGVVRKRLMPIQFTCEIKENIDPDAAIYSSEDSKVSLGKLKSHSEIYGLALVRVKESLESQVLHIGKLTAKVIKPTWWPKEAPKEKATITKLENDTESN